MQFTVSYSHVHDLENYVNQLHGPYSKSYGTDIGKFAQEEGFPHDFVTKTMDAPTDALAEKYILEYWDHTRPVDFVENIVQKSQEFETVLNANASQIIDILQKVYERSFPFEHIHVFITTFPRRPYHYPDWLMSFSDSDNKDLIRSCKHELNHFMYYHYFKASIISQGLTNQQSEYLKEALAILTNINGIENANKPDILPIQEYVKSQYTHSIDKIIQDTVNKFFK